MLMALAHPSGRRPDARGRARARLESLLLMRLAALTAVACIAGRALAHQASSAVKVRVQLVGSGHAASIQKRAALASAASGAGSLKELRFGVATSAGYFVRFEITDPAVQLLEIHGTGEVIHMTSGVKDVFVPYSKEEQTISYKAKFRHGVVPSGPAPIRATLLP